MRTDLFQDKKCVHVKLDKETHLALRVKCFEMNVSMQELFDEFAKLIAIGENKATRIVENYAHKKLEKIAERKLMKRKHPRVEKIDHETLYSLIENGNEGSEEETD